MWTLGAMRMLLCPHAALGQCVWLGTPLRVTFLVFKLCVAAELNEEASAMHVPGSAGINVLWKSHSQNAIGTWLCFSRPQHRAQLW